MQTKAGINLSPDQETALKALLEFAREGAGYFTLGGLAGTGKTTIMGVLAAELEDISIGFCAYTGKASSVLAKKLPHFDYCGTIHSMIYRPLQDEKGRIIGWRKREDSMPYDLLVIDEASMVSEDIFKDLLEYDIPIIAVGDHGQLPPVKSSFNLMQNPMIKLERIHRQAEGNPIIRLAMQARTTGAIEFGDHGEGVKKVKGIEALNDIELDDCLLLAGTNRMRQYLNKNALEGRSEPRVGDKVICLKNNAQKGIYNGMVGFIKAVGAVGKHWLLLEVDLGEGLTYSGVALKHQFGEGKTLYDWRGPKGEKPEDLWDFAYCLTVHKAQGSESEKVVVIEETMPWMKPEEWKRWLYTAITRAKKELLVIKP